MFLLLFLTLLPLPLLSRVSRVRRLVCLCLGLLRALGIQVKFLHFIVVSHSLPSRHYLPASAFSSSSYFVFVLTLTCHSRGLHGINATDPCRQATLVALVAHPLHSVYVTLAADSPLSFIFASHQVRDEAWTWPNTTMCFDVVPPISVALMACGKTYCISSQLSPQEK